MLLEAYVMLLAARLPIWWHAKCCSVACKCLKINQAAYAACCMTPMLHAACNTPHATNTFFVKLPKLLQVSISPTFYEQLLRQNPFTKKLQTQIVNT